MDDATLKLNIGCGRNIIDGWVNIDHAALPGVDIVYDLEKAAENKLPYDDNSVDECLLSHVIEHIRHALPLMEELYRVAKPGARCVIRCPYGSSNDAWEDPTHVRPYFLGSFGYFSQPFYWRADYGYRGDWQPKRIELSLIKKRLKGQANEAILEEIMTTPNVVMEMACVLEAIKPMREPKAKLQQKPELYFHFIE